MSLTADERRLATELGLSDEACALVKGTAGGKDLRPFIVYGIDGCGMTLGVSVDVSDGDEAERVMVAVQPLLRDRGCRAYWSERRQPDGLGEGNVVAVVKGTDPLAFVRAMGTNGYNHDVSPEDVAGRLRAWESACAFDVVGASESWVAVQFKILPADVCAFAAEVYLFCPDAAEQGVALVRQDDDPEMYARARELCPVVPADVRRRAVEQAAELEGMRDGMPPSLRATMPDAETLANAAEMSVRLLAYELRRKKYLFLWWD